MSYGLELKDADGSWILKGSSRLIRFHSFHTTSVTASSSKITKTITVPGMVNDGTWRAYVGATPAYASGVEFSFFSGYFELSGYFIQAGTVTVILTKV